MKRVIVILGLATLAGPLNADRADAKPEKPKKALKRVVKKLHKLKSYKVTATVKGGEATGRDHRISGRPTVDKTFTQTVRGKVAKVDGKAYRMRLRGADGAIDVSGRWKKLLSTSDGRLISRLFLRPEEHLANALRYAKKGKWVAGKRTPAPTAAGGGIDFESKADPGAGTTERKTKKAKSKAWKKTEIVSNVIKVTAPPQVAVRAFNTIVNSGCFSEG